MQIRSFPACNLGIIESAADELVGKMSAGLLGFNARTGLTIDWPNCFVILGDKTHEWEPQEAWKLTQTAMVRPIFYYYAQIHSKFVGKVLVSIVNSFHFNLGYKGKGKKQRFPLSLHIYISCELNCGWFSASNMFTKL